MDEEQNPVCASLGKSNQIKNRTGLGQVLLRMFLVYSRQALHFPEAAAQGSKEGATVEPRGWEVRSDSSVKNRCPRVFSLISQLT